MWPMGLLLWLLVSRGRGFRCCFVVLFLVYLFVRMEVHCLQCTLSTSESIYDGFLIVLCVPGQVDSEDVDVDGRETLGGIAKTHVTVEPYQEKKYILHFHKACQNQNIEVIYIPNQ